MGIREGFNVLLKKQHDFFPLDEVGGTSAKLADVSIHDWHDLT